MWNAFSPQTTISHFTCDFDYSKSFSVDSNKLKNTSVLFEYFLNTIMKKRTQENYIKKKQKY